MSNSSCIFPLWAHETFDEVLCCFTAGVNGRPACHESLPMSFTAAGNAPSSDLQLQHQRGWDIHSDMRVAYLASAFFRSASAASTTSETSWPATAALSMVRLATQKNTLPHCSMPAAAV